MLPSITEIKNSVLQFYKTVRLTNLQRFIQGCAIHELHDIHEKLHFTI